jgi:predicted nucleic acid-binding protein
LTGFLDTNVVVRYLTGEPPGLAERAAEIIDGVPDLYVTDVVLAETAYVLMSVYRVPRDIVIDHLVAFLQKRNVSPYALDKGLALHGLLLCRPSARVSVPDAMVWAAARSAGADTAYSFDERFPQDGLKVRQRASVG